MGMRMWALPIQADGVLPFRIALGSNESLSVNGQGEHVVKFRFNADEWIRLTPSQRIARCQVLAIEAQRLHGFGSDRMKTLFLSLAIQLKLIAEEIALESKQAN